jgi:6-phosphogluconolactonase (cycloisomerase 2 family)
MVLHNAVFLAGVENSGPGRVRLYSLDPSTAKIESLMVADTGGRDPFDILFLEGHFLVAHAASNDVAVLRLDEAARRLEPVEGSPFRTGGTGARFLATDGARVFVANTTEGTLSVFDFDPESGSLELRRDRRTSVPGCRSLLVKSGRLYVASETRGQIVIFDIAGDGSLAVNEASPVEAEGLNSPSTLVACGKYLYAANARSSPLCAFTFAPDGGLEPLPGSPFNLSRSGVTDMAVVGTSPRRLFAVTGADSTLIAMTISASGALREEDGSPFDLDGPAQAVEGAGTFLLVPGSRLPAMKAWDLQAAATLSATGVKALATEAALVRTAVTD